MSEPNFSRNVASDHYERFAARIKTWLQSTQEDEEVESKLRSRDDSPYLNSTCSADSLGSRENFDPLEPTNYSEAISRGYYYSPKIEDDTTLLTNSVEEDDTLIQLQLSKARVQEEEEARMRARNLAETEAESHHPLLGMILTCFSAVCYAALNLSVKGLMQETAWQEIMLIRMFVTWIATLLWIRLSYGASLPYWGPASKRTLLCLRAFFLWGAMFCCFWSFEFLPVGDAVTLAMSFPVWVSIIAHFVFRDDAQSRLDWLGWVFVLTGLGGVIFVAQPSFLFNNMSDDRFPHRNAGVVIGITSAMCAGAQYVIVNYTKEDCHWLQIEQITAFLSTFILMPLGYIGFALYEYAREGHFAMQWDRLSWFRWLEEISLGLLGFVALALLTRGSQLDAPSRTAICLYLQIPVTYLGQCLISGNIPNYLVWVGIFFVLGSVIVPAARKLRKTKRLGRRIERHNVVFKRGAGESVESSETERYPLLPHNVMPVKYTVPLESLSVESSGGEL